MPAGCYPKDLVVPERTHIEGVYYMIMAGSSKPV